MVHQKRVLAVTALLIGVSASLTGCGLFVEEPITVLFDTRQEALESDEARENWQPEKLPKDAVDILLTYRVDSNEQLITWSGGPLTTSCVPVGAADRRILEKAPKPLNVAAARRCLDGYHSRSEGGRDNAYWVPAH